jgi:hypothetical protein
MINGKLMAENKRLEAERVAMLKERDILEAKLEAFRKDQRTKRSDNYEVDIQRREAYKRSYESIARSLKKYRFMK